MPLHFPQLRIGASGQFPLHRQIHSRTAFPFPNAPAPLRAADDRAGRVEWKLRLRGLSDDEIAKLQSLFRETRGGHESFVFCDPEDNLLVQSENLSAVAWLRSAGVATLSAVDFPEVAQSAWSLSAPSVGLGELWQHADLPTDRYWTFSIYARADAAATLEMFVRSSHGERSRHVKLSSNWERYVLGGNGWPPGHGIDVGVRLAGGSIVQATAAQLDMQAAPAVYRPTFARCGVYPEARFKSPQLRITTIAPHCHQTDLYITAPLPE